MLLYVGELLSTAINNVAVISVLTKKLRKRVRTKNNEEGIRPRRMPDCETVLGRFEVLLSVHYIALYIVCPGGKNIEPLIMPQSFIEFLAFWYRSTLCIYYIFSQHPLSITVGTLE